MRCWAATASPSPAAPAADACGHHVRRSRNHRRASELVRRESSFSVRICVALTSHHQLLRQLLLVRGTEYALPPLPTSALADAIPAFLVFDHVITLGQEANLFWSRRLTGASVVFLLNRYIAILNFILAMCEYAPTTDFVRSLSLSTVLGYR